MLVIIYHYCVTVLVGIVCHCIIIGSSIGEYMFVAITLVTVMVGTGMCYKISGYSTSKVDLCHYNTRYSADSYGSMIVT